MREISIDGGTGKTLKLTKDQRNDLKNFLVLSHTRAANSRFGIENQWKQNIRRYQGSPPEKQGWVPFEEAPRIEITTGATAADTVVAQMEDLIFQVKPPLTIRSRKEEFDDAADAMQDLVNYGVESGVWNFEPGVKEGMLDQVQQGTVIGYIPFTKSIRVTDIRSVKTFGPKIYCVAPENYILPANATKNIQDCIFCTMILYMDKGQLKFSGKENNWSIDEAASADSESEVRKHRLRAAGVQDSDPKGEPRVKVGYTFCYFDFHDGMGERDLEVIWNMTSGYIMKVNYNRYNCRPFVLECYQDRAHLPWGVGVMEMDGPYQDLTTEMWNNHIWNMLVCNTKMYQMPQEMMNESEEIFPGKRWANDSGEIKSVDMGEMNSSAIQAVAFVTQMAKDRIGVSGLQGPARGGNRTPGITMLSALQQANRRFTHPFNNTRNFGAGCVMQCLYRIQEQVRGGAEKAATIKQLKKIMGDEKAALIESLMKRSDIELTDALDVQLTAASVSVNRESDRQNMVMLMTQVMPLYWNAKKELATFIAQPPFPGAKETAEEADKVLDKLYHKVIKTFDQISDVRSLQIDLTPVAEMAEKMDMQFAQLAQGGQQPQGAPPQQGGLPPPSPNGTPMQ